MKVVIFDNPDGTITVRHPVQNPKPESPAARREGETDDQWFERLVDTDSAAPRKGGTRVAVMDTDDLPVDHHHFKLAREWSGAEVVINMAKARVEHAARINEMKLVRARELSDREMIGEDVSTEKAQLQNRDYETAIANAPNPTALKAIWQAGTPRP